MVAGIFSASQAHDERDFTAFEAPFTESRTRFDEALLLVPTLWMEESVTWQGQHHGGPRRQTRAASRTSLSLG